MDLRAARGGISQAVAAADRPRNQRPERASQIPERRSGFDHFAERASDVVGQASFFIAALLLVLVWIPTILVFHSADTWQLVISTITSVMAFLLVALLQNSQRRTDIALHRKLDALAEALLIVMSEQDGEDGHDLRSSVEDLRAAIGLEERI
jgi:low affinity Fe/Cu permease